MEKISEMIKRLCPEGVERVRLGDNCNVLRGKRLTKSQLEENGKYPVLHGGATPMGYYSEYNRKANTTVVVNTGNAGSVFFYDSEFWSSDACFAIYPNSKFDDKYLYLCVYGCEKELKNKIRAGAMPTIDALAVENLRIPLPPLPIQQEIVRILDSFTSMISNLETELASRQKQYEFYRNKLLTFDKNDESVEWQTLGEVAEIGTGSGNTNEGLEEGLYPFYTRGREILRKNTFEYDEEAIITAGDGVGVGKVMHYVNGKYALHQRAYRFKTNEGLSTKYLYYYMQVTFYKYVCGNAVASSVSSLRKPKLQVYPIPVPPLSKQSEIVSTLDTFESLITNIKQELDARKKQYEYYREQLLTFE